jgi:monothiol glutaredoxin
MKGVPEAPQCGFSRTVAKVLEMYEVPHEKMKSYNVLEDPELRTAIKEFSCVFTSRVSRAHLGNIWSSRDWPTIPQLYVDGEFVGGCDIVLESKSFILDARMLGRG